MIIGKTFSFDAAHVLPNHEGKCSRLHGHTYKLEVRIDGLLQQPNPDLKYSEEGMVLDFKYVKEIWKEHLEPKLDHQYLNDTVPIPVTTCELLATWIRDTFFDHLNREGSRGYEVHVRLWETPTSFAEV